MKRTVITILMIAIFAAMTYSQKANNDSIFKRHTFGSTFFLLGNIGDSVNFFQLNYGYQFSSKDNIIVEAITWTYYEPLGTFGASKEFYPGKVRAIGLGLGYQRFLWKNLFATIEPTFFLQQFYGTVNNKIQNGFQLYLQGIVGYRFEFFHKCMFIEPAFAIKYWPVNTNFPASFASIERGAPKHKFEPSFNFGFKF